MMKSGFLKKDSLGILCLGAHSDDIEIGCGGTIMKLLETSPMARVCWVVFSAKGRRRQEAQASARGLLSGAGAKEIIIKDFKDGFFPYSGGEIKAFFEGLKQGITPDLVLTHHRSDLHQDHRLISELTWNTFRDHLIWEYEVPKYDGDLGRPNVFVHLDVRLCEKKVQHIMGQFKTQADNQWFSKETFMALMRLRGVESNSLSGYAEAFHGRKLVFA